MPAPQQLSIDTGDLTFAALAWGEEDAPLALLLHGYPDTAWTWRHLGPALAARGWRAVAPFTRGYAPTGLAPDDRYFVADLVKDVLALQTALGGDERSVLIGHDWGAATVWALTATHADRFARYVALSVPPPPTLLRPFTSLRTLGLGARQTRRSWYFVFNQLPGAVRGQRWLIRRLWREWSPAYDAREDLGHVFAALGDPAHARAAVRYYRDNLQRGLKATFTIAPGAPALYLHGADDGCIGVELGEHFLEDVAPGSRFERVEGAGHFLALEQPERVEELIGAWIGAPDATPARPAS